MGSSSGRLHSLFCTLTQLLLTLTHQQSPEKVKQRLMYSMEKEDVVYLHNGILLSHKKE